MKNLKKQSDPRDLWPAPASDPTNPCSQESAGEFVPNERANERRLVEPGLTDQDRAARGPDRGNLVPRQPDSQGGKP